MADLTKNKIEKTIGERIFDIFNILFMLAIAFIMFYPMWYVVVASFSTSTDLMSYSGLLLTPAGDFTTRAYSFVLKNPAIPRSYLITIFVVVVGTSLNILMTSLAAYYVTRKNQFLSKYVMLMIMFTMFFSGGMIPDYLNVRSLGLYNSLWALIVPGSISVFNCIILKTSFEALPASLDESARLDGANDFTILFNIFIPLSKSVIAVLVLYYGVAHWNSWFSAMLYIQDRNKFPLQMILREILITNDTSSMANTMSDVTLIAETIKYALIIVTTAPILLLYPFLQKYFTKGVLVGAVKG